MFRGASALEPEVTESGEFYEVNDEIRRWSSLSEGECQSFVEDGVQLSEVNLDPDVKPSLQDVMDKYYEMFRGKNHPNKTDF